MADENRDSLWLKKDHNTDWAISDTPLFLGATSAIIRIEAPDGSSALVSKVAWPVPRYYLNVLVVNGIPAKETQFASRAWSGITDAVFDKATNSWFGKCRRESGVFFKWTICVSEKRIEFEKETDPGNPFPNGLSVPRTGGESEWSGDMG